MVRGAAGNDRIRVRDGELDVISCGPGFDVAILDFADVIDGATPMRRRTAIASACAALRRGPERDGARARARGGRAFPDSRGSSADMYIGIGTLIIIIILLIILVF